MAVARKNANDGWVRCGTCGHKLGKMFGVWGSRNAFPALEIKCHSCKTLNYVMIGGKNEIESNSVGVSAGNGLD